MPTGNAIQTATVISGGGGPGGTATVALALADNTGSVSAAGANPPLGAGSLLTSVTSITAEWSTTDGTTGSAGFATNSGTATIAGFATNAGTATIAGFATNAGTATVSGFATNAGTATVSGTATIANALTDATGTVNVAAAAAPGAAGSVLVSQSGTSAIWSTTTGTAGSAAFATNAGTATTSTFATNAGTASVGTLYQINTGTAAIGTSTLVTDLGPAFPVTANSLGSGTTLQAQSWVAFGNIGAAGTGTLGVYWGGVAGTMLTSQVINATDLANDAFQMQVSILAITNSTVQVAFYGFGIVSTTYAGLNSTTTTNNLTFGIHWNFNGSGTVTPVAAHGYLTVT
jgi:hypothetical protein